MAFSPGTRLGAYEIVSAIGAGGMGEVYRARDMKLGRDVALKVIAPSLSSDPERVARFEREAQMLAALNHPHIAAIYGFDRAEAAQFLVMELVEGGTLAERLTAGALPVPEALAIARQIADALQAAHDKGIIHRDLKPSNIALSSDGQVKVLDFGLAKSVELSAASDVSLSPTISMAATQPGVILGTAAYMAPEQAKGKPTDRRADMWAFGCVLYEMLTGKPAFDGEDLTDIIGAVARLEPAWDALPKNVPPAIRLLLRTCLQKDRRKRTAEAGTALFVLDHSQELTASQPTGGTSNRRPSIVAAAIAGAAILAAGLTWIVQRPPTAAVVRSNIVTSAPVVLAVNGADRDLVITPDGQHIAYRGANQLLIRRLDQLQPTVVTGVGAARGLFSSPDGQWIGYFDGNAAIRKVPITGGPPLTITSFREGANSRGATWSGNGTIVYATGAVESGLAAVPAAGGEPRVLTKPDTARGEVDHVWPEFLPNGEVALFTITHGLGVESSEIAAFDLRSGTTRVLVSGGSHAHYLRSGHLVFAVGNSLRAVQFDPDTLEVNGIPVPVIEGVSVTAQGALNAAFAADGTLAYIPGGDGNAGTGRSLVWVGRDGREEDVPTPQRLYESLALSPDGTRVAIQVSDQDQDVWVWDFGRRTLTRLSFDRAIDFDPQWSRDGSRVFFSRSGIGIVSRAANGTGVEERVAAGGAPLSVSPDGKYLVVVRSNDVGLITLGAKSDIAPLLNTAFLETRAYISPDGRWLTYQSNESGRDEVYVAAFPDVSAGRWQVSSTGGSDPAWARNGRELFFIDGSGALVTIPVQTQPTFHAGPPRKLFDTTRYRAATGTTRYAVAPDGQRFLFVREADASRAETVPTIVLVQNWFDELNRRVPKN